MSAALHYTLTSSVLTRTRSPCSTTETLIPLLPLYPCHQQSNFITHHRTLDLNEQWYFEPDPSTEHKICLRRVSASFMLYARSTIPPERMQKTDQSCGTGVFETRLRCACFRGRYDNPRCQGVGYLAFWEMELDASNWERA